MQPVPWILLGVTLDQPGGDSFSGTFVISCIGSIYPRWSVLRSARIMSSRTQNYVSFHGFLLQKIGVVKTTKYNSDIWKGLLHQLGLIFGSDQTCILIFGMLRVQDVHCIAGNVACDASPCPESQLLVDGLAA